MLFFRTRNLQKARNLKIKRGEEMYEELIEKRKECERVLNDMIVGLEDLKEKTKNNLLVSGGENVVQSFTKLSKIFNAGIKDIAEAREEFLRDFQVAYSSFNGQNEARLNNEQRWSLGYIKRELEKFKDTSSDRNVKVMLALATLAKDISDNFPDVLPPIYAEIDAMLKKNYNYHMKNTGDFNAEVRNFPLVDEKGNTVLTIRIKEKSM